MKNVFNFSHPLSQKAKDQLTEMVGENKVHNITVQLDLLSPLVNQVFDICDGAVSEFGDPDYIICPGLAPAAVLIDRYFSTPEDDYPPIVSYTKTIRLVMESGSTPPVFVVGEVW